MTWQSKDPDEIADYQISWAATLGTDTISTSVWIVPAGITAGVTTNTDTTVTIFLSGGVDGVRYDLTNTITTAAGRTYEQLISVYVVSNALSNVLNTTVGGLESDSYGTLAAYQAYATGEGFALDPSDLLNESNLRKAANFLDRRFMFIGAQQYQFQQRAWPRLVNDLVNDWPINPDTIPQKVIYAQFEVAYILQGGVEPFATIVTNSTSESIKVGPITIDSTTLPTSTPRIVAVEGLLRGYIKGGPGMVNMRRG
jgi:hypothetical protein